MRLPPPSLEEIRAHANAIRALAARHGAAEISVVGSVARGSARLGSDVDFLVDMAPGRRLLDVGALQFALEALLRCPVHLITVKDLPPPVVADMRREARPL